MGQGIFADEDLRQIEGHGLSVEKVFKHLDLFKMPTPYLKLLRPCTRGDGIKVIDQEKMKALIETYELEIPKRHCLKFVPASGAASRMFKTLLRIKNQEKDIIMGPVTRGGQVDQPEEQELLEFMNCTKKFAFFDDLKYVMSKSGLHIDTLLEQGQFADIIRFLLSDSGLNYASLPKGLLKFHEYADRCRTAFEEHLVEAASYIADHDKQCFLHFTVSQEHLEKFGTLLEEVRSLYEQEYQVSFHVTFSMQKKSTDTIAVGLDVNPLRDKKGRLLFRPGGHGSLIENVNDLKGDIVFIKNIDNVVPDRLKSETFRWKKILGGISWDAWFMYCGALTLGALLKESGAALWLAQSFLKILGYVGMSEGYGLWVGLSGLSGLMTNFMSDAGTTALLGPIVIPMGIMTGVQGEPWAVGLAVAFATSFAHFLIVGTPNNAIVYGLGIYPDTGEKMLHPMDFVKYGFILWVLSMGVLWIVEFLVVYNIVGFPEGILETARQAMESTGQ